MEFNLLNDIINSKNKLIKYKSGNKSFTLEEHNKIQNEILYLFKTGNSLIEYEVYNDFIYNLYFYIIKNFIEYECFFKLINEEVERITFFINNDKSIISERMNLYNKVSEYLKNSISMKKMKKKENFIDQSKENIIFLKTQAKKERKSVKSDDYNLKLNLTKIEFIQEIEFEKEIEISCEFEDVQEEIISNYENENENENKNDIDIDIKKENDIIIDDENWINNCNQNQNTNLSIYSIANEEINESHFNSQKISQIKSEKIEIQPNTKTINNKQDSINTSNSFISYESKSKTNIISINLIPSQYKEFNNILNSNQDSISSYIKSKNIFLNKTQKKGFFETYVMLINKKKMDLFKDIIFYKDKKVLNDLYIKYVTYIKGMSYIDYDEIVNVSDIVISKMLLNKKMSNNIVKLLKEIIFIDHSIQDSLFICKYSNETYINNKLYRLFSSGKYLNCRDLQYYSTYLYDLIVYTQFLFVIDSSLFNPYLLVYIILLCNFQVKFSIIDPVSLYHIKNLYKNFFFCDCDSISNDKSDDRLQSISRLDKEYINNSTCKCMQSYKSFLYKFIRERLKNEDSSYFESLLNNINQYKNKKDYFYFLLFEVEELLLLEVVLKEYFLFFEEGSPSSNKDIDLTLLISNDSILNECFYSIQNIFNIIKLLQIKMKYYHEENHEELRENLLNLEKDIFLTCKIDDYTDNDGNLDLSIKQRHKNMDKYKNLINYIKKILPSGILKYRLYPYGSVTQLLGSTTSDLDLKIEINNLSFDNLDIVKSMFKRFVKKTKAEVILTDRLFTIKCQHKELKIDYDLNFFSECGYYNSFYIYLLCKINPTFWVLSMYLKDFVKKISSNINKKTGSQIINSYTWNLLLISFCQNLDPPILPRILRNKYIPSEICGYEYKNFKKPPTNVKRKPYSNALIEEGFDSLISENKTPYLISKTLLKIIEIYELPKKNIPAEIISILTWESKNTLEISVLFLNFLEFFIGIKSNSTLIDCFYEEIRSVSSVDKKDNYYYTINNREYGLYIKDPFDHLYNPSHIKVQDFIYIKNEVLYLYEKFHIKGLFFERFEKKSPVKIELVNEENDDNSL